MRFNKDAESRIADLEKQVDNLNRKFVTRSYGNQGATPIGFRMPWVTFKLKWQYTDPTYGYGMFWEPEAFGTGETYWGSEVDCGIHATETNGLQPWPKFQIVGRGTWLAIFQVTFPCRPIVSTTVITQTYFHSRFFYLDDTPNITYAANTESPHSNLCFVVVPRTSNLVLPEDHLHSLQFDTIFTASGNVTPANPYNLQLAFRHYFFSREVGNNAVMNATYERPLNFANITFVKLDSEPLRRTRFIMPGEGELGDPGDPPPPPPP